MTAPQIDRLDEPNDGPNALEEVGSVETPVYNIVEEMSSQPGTLGADAPEEFRGKSLNDMFSMVQQLQNTVRVNEEVMRRISSTPAQPQVIQVQQQPAVPVTPASQGPTQAELEAMIVHDDPKVRLAAWQHMQQVNNVMLAEALNRRLAPLMAGTMSSAEQQARQKYGLEFEIFANEIAELRKRVPDTAMATPEAWDELVAQARGRDPLKYVTELQKRSGTTSIEVARARQAASVGFVPPVRSAAPPVQSGSSTQLSDLQRQVAAEFGMTEKEYRHFDRTGDVI